MSRALGRGIIKNMEKEPKFEKSLEEKLREKGYKIEPVEEENLAQCDKDNCFNEAKWFIEGSFCCPEHKEGSLKMLEEVAEDVERKKLEQERIEEERLKSSRLDNNPHGSGNK